MFTLKIILVGLIALAPHPEGNGMMALLVDAQAVDRNMPQHDSWVLLWQGECDGDGCGGEEPPFADFDLAWKLDDQELLLRTYLDPVGWQQASGRDGEEPYPDDTDDVEDLSWVPNLSKLVSDAAVPADCFGAAGTCPIKARVRLDQGRIATCHLIHDNNDDGNLGDTLVFESGAMTQAVANAVVVSMKIDAGPGFVTLHGSGFTGDGSEDAVLRPFGGFITLMIVNEPLSDIPTTARPPGDAVAVPTPAATIDRLEHFGVFYSLASKERPDLPGLTGRHQTEYARGSCESDLVALECCVMAGNCRTNDAVGTTCAVPPMAPHGPSECDLVNIP